MTDFGKLASALAPTLVAAPIRYAVVISTNPSVGTVVVRPSNATATDGSQDITARFLMNVPPGVGTVVRIEVSQGDVLVLGSPGLDAYPADPFAVSAGQINVVITAATQGSAAVSFPAGRFTQPPIVTFGVDNAASAVVFSTRMSGAPTTSGFTAVVNASSAVSITYPVAWIAVQMTSTTAAG